LSKHRDYTSLTPSNRLVSGQKGEQTAQACANAGYNSWLRVRELQCGTMCRLHTAVFVLFLASTSMAQELKTSDASRTHEAGLRGVVTDATGASLPKARVLVVNLRSLQTQIAEVPEDGGFTFPNLKPGDYAVIVAGPVDSASACWQSAVRQIKIAEGVAATIRVPLLLDNRKCPGIVN
jgi:hypothetical protein